MPKYQEIRGQAGRLSENRPVADYKECIKSCLSIIEGQVLYNLLVGLSLNNSFVGQWYLLVCSILNFSNGTYI